MPKIHDIQFFNDTVAVRFDSEGRIESIQFYVDAKNGYANTWMDVGVDDFKERNKAYFEFIQTAVDEWLNCLEELEKYNGKAV